MAKATLSKPVVVPPEGTVILELTESEAAYLRALTGIQRASDVNHGIYTSLHNLKLSRAWEYESRDAIADGRSKPA